jgi:hypothetical protein
VLDIGHSALAFALPRGPPARPAARPTAVQVSIMATTQLVTGAGVALVGAACGFLVTLVTEYRHRSSRWGERRREAFADFAVAVKEEVYLCARMATHLRLLVPDSTSEPVPDRPLDPKKGLPQLDKVSHRRASLIENIRLLADPKVVTRADEYKDIAAKLRNLVDLENSAPGSVTANEFGTEFKNAKEARTAFHAAAGESLGVPRR